MILTIFLVNVVFQRPPTIEKGSEFAALQRKGTTTAPAGTTKPKGGEAERQGERQLLSTSEALEVVPSRLGAGATFITSTCCCLSLFRQASTFSLSAGRLERKKRHQEQSLQCISLYNLQYIWNYFCEFMLLLYLLTLLWKYIFLQLFQKNIESIYPSKIKYRRERRNSYRSCL